MVGLLVDREGIRAGFEKSSVVRFLHRKHLQGDGGKEPLQDAHRFLQVFRRGSGGGLPGQDHDVADAHGVDGTGLCLDLLVGEGRAGKTAGAVEAAIGAVVGAVIGDVERREEGDGPAEMLPGQPLCFSGHFFEMLCCGGGKEVG